MKQTWSRNSGLCCLFSSFIDRWVPTWNSSICTIFSGALWFRWKNPIRWGKMIFIPLCRIWINWLHRSLIERRQPTFARWNDVHYSFVRSLFENQKFLCCAVVGSEAQRFAALVDQVSFIRFHFWFLLNFVLLFHMKLHVKPPAGIILDCHDSFSIIHSLFRCWWSNIRNLFTIHSWLKPFICCLGSKLHPTNSRWYAIGIAFWLQYVHCVFIVVR